MVFCVRCFAHDSVGKGKVIAMDVNRVSWVRYGYLICFKRVLLVRCGLRGRAKVVWYSYGMVG